MSLSSLRSELQQERKERKSLERKNARLQKKLEFANKNRFGSKSQKSNKPKSATAESEIQTSADRGKEEDNFDGTSGSIEKEVSVLPDGTKHVAKERDLSNRPNNYSTMGIRNGNVEVHMTDRSKVPGHIISSDDSKMVKVFSLA